MVEGPVPHVPLDLEATSAAPTPFRPGEQPLFIGGRVAQRRAIVEWADRIAARQSTSALLVYGPRGTGKTTLTAFLAEQLGATGWLPVPLRGDLADSLARQVTSLGRSNVATTWSVGFDLKVLQANVERATVSSGEMTLPEIAAELAGGALNGVVFIVDEAQAAAQGELAALTVVLEDLADARQTPVAVALFGTERLVEVIGPQHGSLGRLHRSEHVELTIGQTAAETSDICTGTLQGHAGISQPAIAAIHADTGGFPHGIQVYGELAYEAADGAVITKAHVEAVRDDAYRRLSQQVFQMMWRRQGSRGPVPMRSREYLRAVADGVRTHAEVSQRLDIRPTSLAQIRHELIARGALVADGGELRFGIPLMRRFVLESSD